MESKRIRVVKSDRWEHVTGTIISQCGAYYHVRLDKPTSLGVTSTTAFLKPENVEIIESLPLSKEYIDTVSKMGITNNECLQVDYLYNTSVIMTTKIDPYVMSDVEGLTDTQNMLVKDAYSNGNIGYIELAPNEIKTLIKDLTNWLQLQGIETV